MKEINLSVNKMQVYDEVAKTTAYTGSKKVGDETAYDRIFTTDDDRMMLERFWVEACNGATEQMKRYVTSVSAQPVSHGIELERNYDVTLSVGLRFESSLLEGMETSLFSYFVAYITAKWLAISSKDDAQAYATDAAGAMDDVMKKLYHRRRPKRVAPAAQQQDTQIDTGNTVNPGAMEQDNRENEEQRETDRGDQGL